MYHGYIDVPTFSYFEFGNVYSGSLLDDFNYHIARNKSEDGTYIFTSAVWRGKICFESIDKNQEAKISGAFEKFEDDFSEDGYEKLIDRINEKIQEILNELGLLKFQR